MVQDSKEKTKWRYNSWIWKESTSNLCEETQSDDELTEEENSDDMKARMNSILK